MREKQITIGGEQSGHIVLTDFVTTGDALIAALQLLAIVKDRGELASKVLSVDPVPQILENVHYGKTDPLVDPSVKDALAKAETELGETGRLVIRKSGTEPVIRVMVVHWTRASLKRSFAKLSQSLRQPSAQTVANNMPRPTALITGIAGQTVPILRRNYSIWDMMSVVVSVVRNKTSGAFSDWH